MTNVVSEITARYVLPIASRDLTEYFDVLAESCAVHPPIHGLAWYGQRYRELARDPVWLANSLVVNAEKEGFGSARIWAFSSRIDDELIAGHVRQHSIDESRHSRLFVRLLELAFPGSLTRELRRQLESLSPGYTARKHPEASRAKEMAALDRERVIDEILQVNLVEIRSLFLQMLLRPVLLAHAEPTAHPRLVKILDSLLADEARHIEYSAATVAQALSGGDRSLVRDLMIRRQGDLNCITCGEVAQEGYNFCNGCGACSPRPEDANERLDMRSSTHAVANRRAD